MSSANPSLAFDARQVCVERVAAVGGDLIQIAMAAPLNDDVMSCHDEIVMALLGHLDETVSFRAEMIQAIAIYLGEPVWR